MYNYITTTILLYACLCVIRVLTTCLNKIPLPIIPNPNNNSYILLLYHTCTHSNHNLLNVTIAIIIVKL